MVGSTVIDWNVAVASKYSNTSAATNNYADKTDHMICSDWATPTVISVLL